MAGSNKNAVFLALIGNSILTVIKFAAFLLSGSGAMLSESIHSLADSANQGLLFLGVRRSERPADATYHYGYGGERFFFAFMAAVGIFVLGCGVTVYHGISSLFHPPSLEFTMITFVVLGISLLVDGGVLLAAIREVSAKKGKDSLWKFIRTSTDPTLLAVLFEDFIASLGVVVAMIGIGLSYWTGNAVFDSLSSIIIGMLLGVMAMWLGLRNRTLLLGPAIPKRMQDEIVAFLEEQPSIDKVRIVRTRIVGAERFRLAVEVDYNGFFLGRTQTDWVREHKDQIIAGDYEEFAAEFGDRMVELVGDEVDSLEQRLYARFPRLKHVDIEAD